MSISVKNISKLYGEQRALDNVSFEVGKGQVVGFLGPNGAGKSTMMKILTCFIPQSDGQALVCGLDVAEESIQVRNKIGYLPEHNPLYPEMFVKEYLLYVAGIFNIRKPKERIREMISVTGLQTEQNKRIGMLSKGYRQRVGLAQAMIHDPEVLILDEPTSGLDPNQLAEIRALIRSVGKEKTVLLSTHIMQEVEAISDRVIIINKGKIVADENTAVLQNTPRQQDVVLIEFEKEISTNDLKKINGVVNAEHVQNNQWRISGRADADIRASLFKWAVENNYTILSLQKEEQRLEDVFQQLTGKK